MAVYKTALVDACTSTSNSGEKEEKKLSLSEANLLASQALLQHTATKIIQAMDEVIRIPPRLPKRLREGVYEWLALMVGWKEDDGDDQRGRKMVIEEMLSVLGGKVGRGLL
jgi:hypothetical protein